MTDFQMIFWRYTLGHQSLDDIPLNAFPSAGIGVEGVFLEASIETKETNKNMSWSRLGSI
jgi:hypothetical protein